MTEFEVTKGKYAKLFAKWVKEDQDFVRWMAKFDAKATQRNYWQRMVTLHEGTKLAPKDIVARYKKGGQTRQKLIDDIDAFLNALKQSGKVATSRMIWAAIVSLLIHRGAISTQRQFELKQPKQERIPSHPIPTQEQFETMLRFAECVRDRYLASQLRYSGGRRGIVEDPEPMKLSNILDLDFEALGKNEIKFKHPTSCALLFYGTVKNGQIERYEETYVSFIPPQAMTHLKDYLEERIRKSEYLGPDSYLFAPERHDANVNGRAAYLKNDQASRLISNLSKAAGYVLKDEKTGEIKPKYHASSLRKLFYNSIQGIDDVDREALQGHIKGVKAHYHGSVDEMPKVIELMRERYEFGMRAFIAAVTPEKQRKQALIDFARMQGLTEEDINKVQRTLGLAITVERLRDALRQSIERKQKASETKPSMTNGGKAYDALLVDENDLVQYLEAGWELVSVVNSKVAIRRPTH